jgi:quinoprotein glucose dehydrogenase
MSFNPQLGYLFVNTNEMGQLSGLRDRDPAAGGRAQADGVGNRVIRTLRTTAFPEAAVQGEQPLLSAAAWGQMNAIDVNTGEFVWRVTLGVTDSLPPDKQNTGRPGNGGSIATAGGLVFVGATDDARFRAFDAKTGKELWTFKLGGAANATPSTYRGKDGRQYVVTVSTGGGFFEAPLADDSIVAVRAFR